MECCERKTERTEQEKKALISRLNRLSGQIDGVKKMVLADRYCEDILIQLLAVTKAAKSLANLIIEKHMLSCVLNNVKQGNLEILTEVADMFKRFQ